MCATGVCEEEREVIKESIKRIIVQVVFKYGKNHAGHFCMGKLQMTEIWGNLLYFISFYQQLYEVSFIQHIFTKKQPRLK